MFVLKKDANGHVIEESVKKVAYAHSASASVAAGGSETIVIQIPAGRHAFVKSLSVSGGSVSEIRIDGAPIPDKASVDDFAAVYGRLPSTRTTVEVEVASSIGETVTVEVKGYYIPFRVF
ncbi:hypothetical protein [Paludifilum halophilum]|uniref:Uncharacterized protein n=1 Tax=Paludifilum halophilum TaxID=1642702 RepID=A0A235B1V7_9BACL|nr:hypothetical protein [Paludifilum halophilum]OYD06290.1 hypothetical protein CHM34_17145 [Paludifilum halophilum]